jgi:protein-tyrosine kinase
MSRIHEALKKAEQERAAQHPNEQASLSADILGASATPVAAAATATAVDVLTDPVLISSPMSTAVLRFEDLRARCTNVHWRLDPNQNVFLDSDPATHGAEQFRTLRSRLYQLRGNQTLKSILVTSSIPGEGKTFIVNNLAQAIVRQPDRRALIIDADLRRPRVHQLLGAPAAPGLTEYLRGEVDELGVIQCGSESNLCLIPGGNEVTNPSELLSNGRLKELLNRVAPIFDWVILDSPPAVPVADASLLADMCDGILLVVRAGSTPAEVAQRAAQELQGRNVVGVVLNATAQAHLYEAYYYESYGYGEPSPSGA